MLGHRLSITNYVYELIRDGTKRLYVDESMSFLVKKKLMWFGLKVHAPVAKLNIEERIIYVLVCPTPECGPKPQRQVYAN